MRESFLPDRARLWRRFSVLFLILASLNWSSGQILFGAEPPLSIEESSFFEQKIRPLLIEKCYACHSGQQKIKGGLRLDSRPGWMQGGETGPAIVAGQPDESLLIRAVRYNDADLRMPPNKKLHDAEIAVLEEWVKRGAPDPRVENTPKNAPTTNRDDRLSHWAFRPLLSTVSPMVNDSNWPQGAIDQFILTKLQERRLSPTHDTDRYTWLRRVTLDLTGLPPTLEEIVQFVGDTSELSYETVVDRLLASPRFGERWARGWLDLVGYADQIGSANNVPADHAWRYRDYVIRAYQEDKPFDVFIREQIAGDLLSARTIEERRDQLTATGFLVLGNINIVEADKLVLKWDVVDQQIEKTGKAFLGMTLNCVRCHDHKFDPITLKDYYGLAGIFGSSESTYKVDRGVWSSLTWAALPETLEEFTTREALVRVHEKQVAETREARELALARIKELESQIVAAKADPPPAGTRPVAELEKELNEQRGKAGSLEQRLWHLDYLNPGTPIAYNVKDSNEFRDAKIQVRGNPHVLGESAPRDFIAALSHGPAPSIPADQSGRVQLAEWLTQAGSPLVARVTVNRIWQKLLGRGLAPAVDYFGVRSEPPSHPELLDYLASEFVRDGWSQKRLIRRIVLSRTYRQSSEITESSRNALAADPENRWLWRMSPRRLEAEMLRDSILAISGQLRTTRGGRALAPEFLENVGGLNPKDVNPISFALNKFRDDQWSVRTVYLPVVRSSEQRGPADVLNFFDFSQPARFSSDRPTTTVASQALFLLNGPVLKEGANKLSQLTTADASLADDEARVAQLYLKILNRPARATEVALVREKIITLTPPSGGADSAGGRLTDAERTSSWQRLIHALFASNEFLFRL